MTPGSDTRLIVIILIGAAVSLICYKLFGKLSPEREGYLSMAVAWFAFIAGAMAVAGFLLLLGIDVSSH